MPFIPYKIRRLRMLIPLRSLKPALAAAMAALLAFGFLVANPGVSLEDSGIGVLGSLVTASSEAPASPGGSAGEHHHGGHGMLHHASESTPAHPDSHGDHAGHGCEECLCVAAAGCAAPAAPTSTSSTKASPATRDVGIARTFVLPTPPLHHDIFRPPRAA
ncbi:MAG: hypothetical protein EA350_15770 [Gemmatimonadales bacterium]|nr:MAG: hypothetical protein EA350_15770 [Gemmatimonadales bacterium]